MEYLCKTQSHTLASRKSRHFLVDFILRKQKCTELVSYLGLRQIRIGIMIIVNDRFVGSVLRHPLVKISCLHINTESKITRQRFDIPDKGF